MASHQLISGLAGLPLELITDILAFLSIQDMKSLRLVSPIFAKVVTIPIKRVFLSANPRNIEVLRAIADHETMRFGVTEIIWDDAQLLRRPLLEETLRDYRSENMKFDDPVTVGGCPRWFKDACDQNVKELRHRYSYDEDRIKPQTDERMDQLSCLKSLEECWKYYRELLASQDRVFATDADIAAFKYGLARFPSLQRVTITPATHGFLFGPLYETPMIRDFPYGFNYPIPRGWPSWMRRDATHVDAQQWMGGNLERLKWFYGSKANFQGYRALWRGYRAATRILAQTSHPLQELVVDSHYLPSGVNCHIFDQVCPEYEDFCVILKQPGFRRLAFSLFVDGIEWGGFKTYRTGLLFNALSEAQDLEHFHLHSTLEMEKPGRAIAPFTTTIENQFIPLGSIFPIEKWPKLQYFGLSQFLVTQSDLVSFLAKLPLSVRSIQLNLLMFIDGEGNYHDLLVEMRDTLDWRHRTESTRPKVVVAAPQYKNDVMGRVVWLDDSVNQFLYNNGANPFLSFPDGPSELSNTVHSSADGIERDEFDHLHKQIYQGPIF